MNIIVGIVLGLIFYSFSIDFITQGSDAAAWPGEGRFFYIFGLLIAGGAGAIIGDLHRLWDHLCTTIEVCYEIYLKVRGKL